MTPIERGSRAVALVVAASAVLALGACGRDTQDVRGGAQGDVTLPQQQGKVAKATDTTGLPPEGALARVAVGDLAGVGNNTLDAQVANPYANDRAAVEVGHEMFVNMNCASCHGYDLKGGMGPDLTDTYWRYGGSPADIYKSIYEGRPQGMPAWGRALPPQVIWKVVSYIQSKGGTFPGRLADLGRQGNLGDDVDTTSFSTLKGRNNVY
ncbi:MAG TPA: c-type cytochrome [Gemmatimonadaceae bacterium]|jgi:cytochrome c oxidase cbb3-type subunit 3